jgi:hypothetical protein
MPMEALSRNLAKTDRAIRVGIGALALVLALAGWLPGLTGLAVLSFAWVPILTGLVGWCPVYTLLGVSTRRR